MRESERSFSLRKGVFASCFRYYVVPACRCVLVLTGNVDRRVLRPSFRCPRVPRMLRQVVCSPVVDCRGTAIELVFPYTRSGFQIIENPGDAYGFDDYLFGSTVCGYLSIMFVLNCTLNDVCEVSRHVLPLKSYAYRFID